MKKTTYFVPVDFSNASYKALQYAMALAKTTNADIFLFHVIDSEKISDSANPVSVKTSIEKLEKEAEKKMFSLSEILSISGIVVSHKIVFGSEKREIEKEIYASKPDLAIMGKNEKGTMASDISRQIHCPVIVVPETVNPSVPNHIAFFNKVSPLSESPNILLNLVRQKKGKFSILKIGKNGKEVFSEKWLSEFNNGNSQNNGSFVNTLVSLDEINEAAGKHNIDLIFAKIPPRIFLPDLFRKNMAKELVMKSEIPVLLEGRS